MTLLPPTIADLMPVLDAIFDEVLSCTSNAPHDCSVQAVALCTSKCNDETKYWCTRRYEMYLNESSKNYAIVCSACGDPVPVDWLVYPI